MSLDPTAIYRASPDVTCCPLGDGLALFDLRSNSYFSLNGSGALIWERAGRPISLAGLNAEMAQAYGKPEYLIAADVEQAVVALIKAQLLLVQTETPPSLTESAIHTDPQRA